MMLIIRTFRNKTEYFFENERKNLLLNEAIILANNISKVEYLNFSDFDGLTKYVNSRSSLNQQRIIILNADAVVIADSNDTTVGKTLISKEIINALENINDATYKSKENAIYATSTIIDNSTDKGVGVVLVVSSTEDLGYLLKEITKSVYYNAVLIGACVVVIIMLISKWINSPLKFITPVIERISKGDFTARIESHENQEFQVLIETFNDMVDKIEKIEKARDEFVSNVSHEIKTPLSSIKVLSESLLIEEVVDTDVYREFLGDIVSETDRLTVIVNDLMNLVKLDQGEIALNIKKTDINMLILNIIKRLKPISANKDIEIEYTEVNDIEAEIDEIKIDLAIGNVVNNAIKYTVNHGIVKISLEKKGSMIVIDIRDTGVGMENEELDHIFKRFYRVDKMRGRETGGTGLGLAIMYSSIMLHGGEVHVQSEVGVGSTFTVSIPMLYKGGEL